jgi:hypothetical protein
MATLTEQIEQLRLQIKQVAVDEHALVKELSEAAGGSAARSCRA